MFADKRVAVVMPAYNAVRTLEKTYREVREQPFVDDVVIVDDSSTDATSDLARRLGATRVLEHESNLGYGANQKTCYEAALDLGASIVVMIHADYQYTPKLIPAMVTLIGSGTFHCVLGSRILGGQALRGGMPRWRYLANRFLTFVSNVALGAKLSEYHSGYRAFSRELLEVLPLQSNSDDFVFDHQMLAQVLWTGVVVAEVSCPTRYFADASSISFARSIVYGIGCLTTATEYLLAKHSMRASRRFRPDLRGRFLKEPT